MRLRSQPHHLALAIATLSVASCATSRESSTPPPGLAQPTAVAAETPSDPRVGLGGGWWDAEEVAWNMRLVSETRPPEPFIPATAGDFSYMNSDLAFTTNYLIQGNFHGIQIWDIADPAAPSLVAALECPGWQNDVSVYGDLLFASVEDLNSRVDCGAEPMPEQVHPDRMRGIRIFDISDIANPRLVTNVQTCRGSHTHTLVTDPDDTANVYIYVSGSAPVRPEAELAGCVAEPHAQDPNSALLRIDVIQVPVDSPEEARIVSSARIFEGLETPPTHPDPDQQVEGQLMGPSPDQCHDITVYPELGLAAGACQGHGLLLDISDPANPTRVADVTDQNFAYWHSATFNNDGSKILFTDEWGGGTAPKCRATDRPEWGANAIFTREGDELTFQSYYKLPVPQTPEENCVAHNGSLVPVPGRDIMAQSWYQGGISVLDWTDPANPYEIAYFDRGPVDTTRMAMGGSWSVYWYNGKLYSSEIARGLDVLELVPSEHISQNEIDAAKLVRFDLLNVQTQPAYEWPAHPAVARAYLDQLERSGGLPAEMIDRARDDLDRLEAEEGLPQRILIVTALATQLEQAAVHEEVGDPEKAWALAEVVRELANAGN